MRFIGDLHGSMLLYSDLIKDCKESIQVGDIGHGFVHIPDFGPTHVHIHGNHDNPNLAIKHRRFLGRFGLTPEGIFYVSGAYSIDRKSLIHGVSLFEREELSYEESMRCIEFYIDNYKKIKAVVSHDAPYEILKMLVDSPINSMTTSLLENLRQIYRPAKWVFGHHHKFFKKKYEGTMFYCAPENGAIDIKIG